MKTHILQNEAASAATANPAPQLGRVGLDEASGSAFRRIDWREAEKIVGRRLDRRKAFYYCDDPELMEYLHGGPVFEYGEWTTTCSGCTESYMGSYSTGSSERGLGCSECGYTGKRRQGHHAPVKISQNE